MARRMKRPILAPTQFNLIPNEQLLQGLNALLDMVESGQWSERLTSAMRLTIQEINWRQFGKFPKLFFYWHYATQYGVYKRGRTIRGKSAGRSRVIRKMSRTANRTGSILNYIEMHLN